MHCQTASHGLQVSRCYVTIRTLLSASYGALLVQFREDIDNISNIALAWLTQRPDASAKATIKPAAYPEIWIVQFYAVEV